MQNSPEAAAFIRRVKVTFAICVAEEIYQRAAKLPMSEKKARHIRLAADALDKTSPDPAIFNNYGAKPGDMSDACFLLANLGSIELLDPAKWPQRKVPQQEWKEYRRIMNGLEAYLSKAFIKKAISNADHADIGETLRFIAPQVAKLDDELVKKVLSGRL